MYQSSRLTTQYGSKKHPRADAANRAKPISPSVACGLLLPIDVAAIVLCAGVSYVVRLTNDPYSIWSEYGLVVAFAALLAANVFHSVGLYDPSILRQQASALRRVVFGWLGVAAVLMATGFITKTSEDYSRMWAMMWLGSGLVSLLAIRWIFFAQAGRWMAQGRLHRKVAIVGSEGLATQLAARFAAQSTAGIEVAGLYTDEGVSADEQETAWHDGDLGDLVAKIRRDSIDTVIIAAPDLNEHRVRPILERLGEVSVDVRLCPGALALRLPHCNFSHYAGIPTLNVMDRPFADWRYAAKAIEDRILGSIILILISPLMLAIAVFIKLDSPGPVFFRQKRYGYNNQLIEVLKFRTMRHDRQDAQAETLTQRNDPRLTRIGAFLRKWSLDELPQFINVLQGEMSIVGPRPHAISAKAGGLLYQDAVPHYARRHRVKPGITGWAQINGWRGTTETVRQIEMRVEHDLYYIANWSLWLDLKIIVLTILKGFGGRNAY